MTDQKEQENKREEMRQNALKNLKAGALNDLAVAYFTQDEENAYGKSPNHAVSEFLYAPALKGNTDLVYNSLVNSREKGRLYSGNISEYKIIKDAATVIQESLVALTVGDIMNLIGAKVPDKGLAETYLGDLLNSEWKEAKEIGQAIVGQYLGYITDKGVSRALSMRADNSKGGLEKVLSEVKTK